MIYVVKLNNKEYEVEVEVLGSDSRVTYTPKTKKVKIKIVEK